MFKKVSTETLKTLADELSRIHASDASELEAAKYARTLSLLMLVELKNRRLLEHTCDDNQPPSYCDLCLTSSGPAQPDGHKPA